MCLGWRRMKRSTAAPSKSRMHFGRGRGGTGLVYAVDQGAGLAGAACEVVRRRQAEPLPQLRGSSRAGQAREKTAILWEGEPGEVRKLTFRELHAEVQRFANVLKDLGVKKGDRVAIYMGMTPELAIALLACARIGAVHSVIFGGFAAQALIDRINDAECVAVVTQDGSYRRGAEVKLKKVVDEALAQCPSVKKVVVYQRTRSDVEMKAGRDFWWHDLMEKAASECPAEPLDAEHPLYILYTSGTTGKPKGLVHTTGGYSVGTYLHQQAGLRSQGRRCVLVLGGHRLGHGSLVCGLRHAAERCHDLNV